MKEREGLQLRCEEAFIKEEFKIPPHNSLVVGDIRLKEGEGFRPIMEHWLFDGRVWREKIQFNYKSKLLFLALWDVRKKEFVPGSLWSADEIKKKVAA